MSVETQPFTKLEPDFPHGYSDDELRQTIASLGAALNHYYSKSGYDLGSPAFQLQILEAALLEQSRRQTETALRSSKLTARISLAIALLALALSLVFGLADYFGDQSWQDDQTRILTEIRDRLP